MSRHAKVPEERVRALWRRVAGQLGVAAILGLLAAGGLLLVAAWAVGGRSFWERPSAVPLLLVLLVAAAAVEWLRRLAIRARRWDVGAVAGEIERSRGLPQGSVRVAVEEDVQRHGTSRSLAELHRTRVGRELDGWKAGQLGGVTASFARSRALAAAIVALAALGGAVAIWSLTPETAAPAWGAVRHPVRYLSPPALPEIVLTADSTRVRRGRDVPVRVEAPRRDSVALVWQPRGAIVQRRWQPVVDGRARAIVPRIEARTAVWATAADGAVSDTLRIEPVDPLLLVDAQVGLRYPPHTGREREVLSVPVPTMVVPVGTRVEVSGSATLPLASAGLASNSGDVLQLRVHDDRRFQGTFPVRSGTWGWQLEGARGEELEGRPDSLDFLTVPDSAPRVRVLYPGRDTVLSTSMTQSLLVDVRDDYGLSRAELISWRVSAWGERGPERVDPLPLGTDEARANIATVLDATGRGFLPGDTLRYFVRGFDNAPTPQEGRSREYALRLPTLDEVRERAVAEGRDLVRSTESLAEGAREQQRATEALERSVDVQPPPGAPTREQAAEGLDFRETQGARGALERAEALLEDARQVEESLRELRESVQRAGLDDPALLDNLREIESLFERVITPEMERRLQDLRSALEELDPERLRDAVRQLAEGSADFRERVERTLELMRRAALEQEFAALEAEAEELSENAGRLDESLRETSADSAAPDAERRAEELAGRAEDLAARIDELTEGLRESSEADAAERSAEASEQASGASRANRQAAESLPGEPRAASRAVRRGRESLRRAAAALREGREGMQGRWREQVTETLDRAGAEALELARRQSRLNEEMESSAGENREGQRSKQGALRKGVDQIENQLSRTSRSSLLIDPRLLQAAARAGAAMDELLDQMSNPGAGERPRPELGGEAAEALNDLAYQLMQARDQVASARSGTGLQEALQQLSELAEQQGQVSSEAGNALPIPLGDALMRELRRLAGRQRAIGQELQQLERSMGPRGQVLGRLDRMAQEAEELARELERGRIDEQVVERQQRLFQRLLDAGRTLERDEFERERRAERPGPGDVFRPEALPPELLEGLRFPHPGTEQLRAYPPAIRRLILEYFDLLNSRESSDGS